jgi:transglutaminase-like putative cysteine protease/tetratricopeptide (TPR) repeat protein
VLVAALVAALAAPAAAAPTPAPKDPFQADLAARQARWQAARGKPEAALAVLDVIALWEYADPAAIRAFVDAAASDGKAHPLARAHAAYLAEEAATRAGDDAAAARWRKQLGLVETWRVIGPFGFDGGDLVGTPYGPEGEVRAKEQGKRGELVWRDVPAAWIRHGVVPLGAMLRPDTQSAGYGLAWVKSDAPRDVAVRAGSPGAIKVWVGGKLAISNKVKNRTLYLDQDTGVAHLERGWNPVLVKVAVEDGGWSFTLRITELDGRALALQTAATPPAGEKVVEGPPGAGTTIARPKKPAADLRALLAARVTAAPKKGPAREAAQRDLAAFLGATSPDDPQDKPVENTLAETGWDDGPGQTPAAATCLLAAREAESPDVRRRGAERAADAKDARPAERAEAHWRLSAYYLGEQGQLKRAREELEAALAADPDYWPADLAMADVLSGLGLDELGRSRVEAVVAARPHAAAALRRLAMMDEAAGRVDEARALYQTLAKLDVDDVGVISRLADLAKDRGDVDGWLAAQRQIRAMRPTSVGAALQLADALKDRGDAAGALAVLDDALVVAPDDARLLEESGRLMVERAGKSEEGIARLKRALAMKPQNPELRRYLARVAPADDDDLERQYTRDAKKLIAQYAGWEKNDENSVVLLDLKVTRVHDNGLSETFVQRLVRVQNQTGASAEQWQGVQYSSDTQSVELRSARVYKPNGEVREAKTEGTREVSEPWYGMYYDVRADVVGFERLEPGDVVEYSYVLSDTGRRNLYADYFGDLHFLGEEHATAETEYTLLSPAGRELYWHVPALPGLKRVDDTVGGEKRTRITVSKLPKLELDPSMPGATEVLPYVHVSTWKSYDQVARWYWRLVEEQLAADDKVKQAAHKAVAGLSDDRAKVRAIHDLVVKSTRYVGLEFGIHSFKPYRVPEIFERKFGDCKDKASLMVVMLREVGIPAQIVLVRTRKNGELDAQPASLAVFDHAIAYVPAMDLYLDGTAEFSGSDELPYQDQGVMVLRIDGGDGTLTHTPVLTADKSQQERTLRLDMKTPGQAELVEDVTASGQWAAPYRQYYQTEGERQGKYEKQWNASLPGFKLKKVEMKSLDDLEQPVRMHAEGQVPQLGQKTTGGAWGLPLLGRPSELLRSFARTSKRTHDLLIDYTFTQIEDVTYVLPKGARVLQAPRSTKITGKHGELELVVDVQEGDRPEVHVRSTLRVNAQRIPLAEYDALRDFLGKTDAALNQPIEFAP